MPSYELDLRIDARSTGADALASALTDASQALRTRLYRELGLRPHSAGWVTLDPLSSQGQRTLQQLIDAPPGDFAYVPWGEDGPNRAGKLMRFRLLILRRRARDALIRAGLFAEKAFPPVLSVATPEAGVARLDELHQPVPPMYSEAELAAMRVAERKLPPAAKAAPPAA